MTFSDQGSPLSKPSGDARIPLGTLSFVRDKLRNDLHSAVLKAFRESGLSQKELARRLGKNDTARLCKNLGAPGNWTINTAADLLFAIDGNFFAVSAIDALALPRDISGPDWLNPQTDGETKGTSKGDHKFDAPSITGTSSSELRLVGTG